jgi:hypothetical protein
LAVPIELTLQERRLAAQLFGLHLAVVDDFNMWCDFYLVGCCVVCDRLRDPESGRGSLVIGVIRFWRFQLN